MDFYSVCDALTRLKMYPVFDAVHFVLMCINVKEDIQKTVSFPFSRQHPLALYAASMLMCFASQIWFCFLFNQPLATLFITPEKIAIASLIWYLVNYMPGDFIYHLLSFKIFKMALISLKEVQRVYAVHSGVTFAIQRYPSHPLVQVVAGVLKGSSYVWMKPFERFIRGYWAPSSNELLQPSFVFKASTVLSILFILEHESMIKIEHTVLFACSILVLIYLRLSMLLLGTRDIFTPFENLICSVIFGGMWDALKRARRTELSNGAVVADNKVKKS